jgi:hypothetical protein
MGLMRLKTTSSRQVWVSSDAKIKIFELGMEYEGKPVKAKTYSAAIAVPGWEGEAETYEKQSKNGLETFVRQPPKEDGQYGSHSSTGTGKTYTPKDEKAIQAMWAIDKAKDIALAFKPEDIPKTLDSTEWLAQELFLMVDRVKAVTVDAINPAPQVPDVVHPVPDDPIDLSQIEARFGPTETLPLKQAEPGAGAGPERETAWLKP